MSNVCRQCLVQASADAGILLSNSTHYLVPEIVTSLCPRRLVDLLDFFTGGRPILKHSFGRLIEGERRQRVG